MVDPDAVTSLLPDPDSPTEAKFDMCSFEGIIKRSVIIIKMNPIMERWTDTLLLINKEASCLLSAHGWTCKPNSLAEEKMQILFCNFNRRTLDKMAQVFVTDRVSANCRIITFAREKSQITKNGGLPAYALRFWPN